VAKAIHSMIRVLDESRSVDFYEKAFALKVAERIDFETFTLVYMSNAENDFELELTINKGREETYDLGSGYGHIAFCVDNLEAEHARMEGLGYAPRQASGAVLFCR
jgi:lactoylglutathione lyase